MVKIISLKIKMNGSRALLFLVFSTRWLLTFETAVQLEFHFAFLDVFFLQFDQVVSVQGGIIFSIGSEGATGTRITIITMIFVVGIWELGKETFSIGRKCCGKWEVSICFLQELDTISFEEIDTVRSIRCTVRGILIDARTKTLL